MTEYTYIQEESYTATLVETGLVDGHVVIFLDGWMDPPLSLSLFMRGRTLRLLLDSPVMMEGLGLLDYKVLIPRMPS